MISGNPGSVKRVVILGNGALGTVFGAALQRAGVSVIFLARNAIADSEPPFQDINFIRRDGHAETLRFDIARDPAVVADADLLMVFVKTPDTIDAIERVAPFLAPETPVVTLQNGLRAAERIRDVLGEDYLVIAAITSQAAMRTGPESVEHTGTGPTLIGFDDVRGKQTAEWIARLLSQADIPATSSDAIDCEIWRKIAVNAAINGPTALGETTNGAITNNPDLRRLALAIAREAARVAAARGCQLGGIEDAVIDTAAASARNRSSMLQDIDSGRLTEVDAIYGEIQRAARLHGIDSPHIDALFALIAARTRMNSAGEKSREQHA